MINPFRQNFLENKVIKISSKVEVEPHEIFLDNLAKKREEGLGISEKKFEIPISRRTFRLFYAGFLLLALVLFAKTYELQVLKGKSYSALADENKTSVLLVRPERGVIYDNCGQQLVFNQPSFDLVCDKRDFPRNENDKKEIFKKLSQILNKDAGVLEEQIKSSEFSPVLLAENLDQQTLILLETSPDFSAKEERSACRTEMNTTRNYISGPSFASLIGYIGKINKEEVKTVSDYSITDYIGKAGLEKSYEKILRGIPGKWKTERDALGQTKSENLDQEPESGKSLALWLDSDLQRKIEEEIASTIKNTGAKAGVGIALNPKTGGVLALVSLPNFDNNILSAGANIDDLHKILNDPSQPLFNRAISGEYPTGSTIKPLMASAALQEKIISPDKRIADPGFIQIPHQYDPEIIYPFYDWTAHGWADLRKAIAVSCNVYFYTIGGGYGDQQGLGPERIKKYLNLFGWGKTTGIDLPGEKEGLIPDANWKKEVIGESWYTGNTYHLSIGQGYLRTTPLQVVAAFAAIANGGKLLAPQVVQKIVDSEKNTVEELNSKVIRENFIDPENLKIIREGMRDAVTYGSSVSLNSLPVKVAAKTGTAEFSEKKEYHNWITVFAPYDDPQIVLTIMIEDVPEQMVAAQPVAKNVLSWYFNR